MAFKEFISQLSPAEVGEDEMEGYRGSAGVLVVDSWGSHFKVHYNFLLKDSSYCWWLLEGVHAGKYGG